MAADDGLLECKFIVPEKDKKRFDEIIAQTDREEGDLSWGLAWLDDVREDNTVRSTSVGHEGIFDTENFLKMLLKEIPEISFKGSIEHSFLVGDGPNTSVLFWTDNGALVWDEKYRCEYCGGRFADSELLGDCPFYCEACATEEELDDEE